MPIFNHYSTQNRKKLEGFSLIELIVVVSIMTLLTGGGIGAYITFNDRQTLRTSALEVQTYLRSAQKRAQTGDRPDSCDRLDKYRFFMGANSNIVTIQIACSNTTITADQYILPEGIKADAAYDIQFAGLHGGVTGTTDVRLNFKNYAYEFEVGPGGEISSGDFVDASGGN